LAEAGKGPGCRNLIQHSAGSGKSNSITWLAHQLVEVQKDGGPVIVVTDRKILDKQIRDNIKQFAQVHNSRCITPFMPRIMGVSLSFF
jgi:type I restriction enzyme, R subunit